MYQSVGIGVQGDKGEKASLKVFVGRGGRSSQSLFHETRVCYKGIIEFDSFMWCALFKMRFARASSIHFISPLGEARHNIRHSRLRGFLGCPPYTRRSWVNYHGMNQGTVS